MVFRAVLGGSPDSVSRGGYGRTGVTPEKDATPPDPARWEKGCKSKTEKQTLKPRLIAARVCRRRRKETKKGRHMKIMAQMAVIGALVAGATAVNAQSTNIDVNVNVSLNGVVQTGSNTSARGRIGTKEVVQALGGSAKAKLLLRFSPDGGEPVFVLRDNGTNDTVLDSGAI